MSFFFLQITAFPEVTLKSSLDIFYGHHQEQVDRYQIYTSQIAVDLFPFNMIVFFPPKATMPLPDLTMSNTACVL
jgi:hypothetical protein